MDHGSSRDEISERQIWMSKNESVPSNSTIIRRSRVVTFKEIHCDVIMKNHRL